jgi:pyrimidine operon attenuation protein / uracil phosphoribosyltransferase
MNETLKTIPQDWKVIIDEETISRLISRISYEIVEKDRDLTKLAIVGVKTGGEHIAKRIRDRIFEIEKVSVPLGVIDITLYRDDIGNTDMYPALKGTDLPFRITNTRIVLVDDVLYTGRTIRAALDAIIDFGRPSCVELAVLVDRGHRELPIRPDYVGRMITTHYNENLKVRLLESGYKDGVYAVEKTKDKENPQMNKSGF